MRCLKKCSVKLKTFVMSIMVMLRMLKQSNGREEKSIEKCVTPVQPEQCHARLTLHFHFCCNELISQLLAFSLDPSATTADLLFSSTQGFRQYRLFSPLLHGRMPPSGITAECNDAACFDLLSGGAAPPATTAHQQQRSDNKAETHTGCLLDFTVCSTCLLHSVIMSNPKQLYASNILLLMFSVKKCLVFQFREFFGEKIFPPYLWAVVPHQSSTFHWRIRKAQIMLKIWVTETRQMMTGRCLRPQAWVYNYAQDCRQRGWKGCWAFILSKLNPQHLSVCPARKLCSELPRAKLESLRGNFTLPRWLHSHFVSAKVPDRD